MEGLCPGGGVLGGVWKWRYSEFCLQHKLGLFLGFRILTFTSFVSLGKKVAILGVLAICSFLFFCFFCFVLFCFYFVVLLFFFFVFFFFFGGWGEGCHFQNLLFLSIKILGIYLGIVRIRVRNFC